MNNEKQDNQTGGAIIGEGQYGCVVRPPFLCRGQSKRDRVTVSKQVGKITQKRDAETELEIAEALSKIPSWKMYYILPIKKCQPKRTDAPQDWSGCTIATEQKSSALIQIISDFQGHTTLAQTDIRPNRFDFFFFFRHLLEGAALMTLRGVVHYDIHGSNILFDRYGVPRFLDFGLSFAIHDFKVADMWKVYDPHYNQEPPEVTAATGLQDGRGAEVFEETIQQKPVFKCMARLFGTKMESQTEQLRSFFLRSRSTVKHDWQQFFTLYWPGFDSFALAAIFAEILQISIRWPKFVDSTEWKEKGERIMRLLPLMLNPVPSERYDCVEALAVYDPQNAVLHDDTARRWLAARASVHPFS